MSVLAVHIDELHHWELDVIFLHKVQHFRCGVKLLIGELLARKGKYLETTVSKTPVQGSELLVVVVSETSL